MKWNVLILFLLSQNLLFAQSSDHPYEKEFSLKDGMRRVLYQNKYGFINESRREVVAPEYLDARDFINGLAEVSKDKKLYGYINTRGSLIIPMEYEQFWYGFRDGYTPVKKNGKWGMITDKNKTVVPFVYDYLYYFSEGLAMAAKDDGRDRKYGFVNDKGREVIPLKYDLITDFNEGLAGVSINNKWGFADKNGKLVIPMEYEKAKGFSGGLAAVKVKGKWGFIDRNNKMVIRAAYDDAYSFEDGEAEVLQGSEGFFINKAGQRLKPGRWLLTFTKGIPMGKQYWFRGKAFTEEPNKKLEEGYRYTDITDNLHENEIFIIMSDGGISGYQTGKYGNSSDRMWEHIKTYNKDNLNITSLAYSHKKWTVMSTRLNKNPEVVLLRTSFPYDKIKEEWAKGKFISSMAFGDDRWVIAMRKDRYSHQVIREYKYDKWDQADIDAHMKKGYIITDLVKDDGTYFVVLTKGTGAKEQLLVWEDEIPVREINQYWNKGYSSYRNFYIPRDITISDEDWDFF